MRGPTERASRAIVLSVLALVCGGLAPSLAHAQHPRRADPCVRFVADEDPPQNLGQLAGPHVAFTVTGRCAFVVEVPSKGTDTTRWVSAGQPVQLPRDDRQYTFPDLVARLAGDLTALNEPRIVRVRACSGATTASSCRIIALDPCTWSDALHRGDLARRDQAYGIEPMLTIERTHPEHPRCAFDAVTYSFDAAPNDDAVNVTRDQPGPHVLAPTATTRLTLERTRYAVYAGVAGHAQLLIGFVVAGSPFTPLQRLFEDEVGAHAWFRADWSTGSLRFLPTQWMPVDAAAEAAVAAETGHLFIRPADEGDGATRSLLANAGEIDRPALALDGDLVTHAMVDMYGPAAESLAPTLSDWRQITTPLLLCLSRYERRSATAPTDAPSETLAATPPDAECVPLAQVISMRAAGRELTNLVRISLVHYWRRLTAQRAHPLARSETEVMQEELTDDEVVGEIFSVGDSMSVVGNSYELELCVDGDCDNFGAGAITFERAGLVELRAGSESVPVARRQGLTLVRVVVVDPYLGWHPVGLIDGGRDDQPPWTRVAQDEDDVFAFNSREHALETHLSVSPLAVAVWARGAAAHPRTGPIGAAIPVVASILAVEPAPETNALVLLPTRAEECPREPAAVARAGLARPHDLFVDEMFSIHLAQYDGPEEPYRCIATARFRVRERRVVASAGLVRLVILGDPGVSVVLAEPFALIATEPVLQTRVVLPGGFGLQCGLDVTLGVAFATGSLMHTGLAFDAGASWGIDDMAPRLVMVGVLVDLLAYDAVAQAPLAVPYVGLNFGSLFELAGGR